MKHYKGEIEVLNTKPPHLVASIDERVWTEKAVTFMLKRRLIESLENHSTINIYECDEEGNTIE